MGHHAPDCRSVSVEIREKHMASVKKNLDAKRSSKAGTQHAAVEEEELSVASITLEDDGMPSREEMLKVMGYQGMNIACVKQKEMASLRVS
jgi:hypothetical protein